MNKEAIINVKLETLNQQINELREILNEICVTSEGTGATKEMLMLSQCLDELIVEYMNHITM
ncbi:MAG: Spo0E like sporulation regulatory protein [Clostridiales bacterium]|jgi:hypothetical protein|nr:Spo0E like sporulation regulatory protein [Clostridiales bacterium]